MDILLICLAAFCSALLTFFSGFGLGTVLTPVMMLFVPVDLAIALTGVVHLINNVFKIMLTGRYASKDVLLRFGIPAVLAAFMGAWVLIHIPEAKPLLTYHAFGKTMEVYTVKLMIAILLILFAVIEFIPGISKLAFDKSKLPIGGAISGFFGGLSGNQGALRSAFLIKAGLTKEAFIGTAVVVSTFVDFTRLGVYATRFSTSGLSDHKSLIIGATLAAILGSILGNKFLKKITIDVIQKIVAIMLILLSIALGSGWL